MTASKGCVLLALCVTVVLGVAGAAASAEEESRIAGRCVEHEGRKPLAGITVKLYRAVGRTAPPEEVASTTTDVNGEYSFDDLAPERPEDRVDRLTYELFGFAKDRPIGIRFMHFKGAKPVGELRMSREKTTVSGMVVEATGRPVAGAIVARIWLDGRPIPELGSAITGADGRFTLKNVAVYRTDKGEVFPMSLLVSHSDFPRTTTMLRDLAAEAKVVLPSGCLISGQVIDAEGGQPAAGALVTARRSDEWGEVFATADADGRYRLAAPEGRYDLLAQSEDRVCVAVTGLDGAAGQSIEAPTLELIAGGLIAGRVLNAVTRRPIAANESGNPIAIGLYGPSEPAGKVISPGRLAEVDAEGRYSMRAAPGENFPFLVNVRGDRMAWDTRRQPAVIVREGATTRYDMLITPEVKPAERLAAARKLVETLPRGSKERTAKILEEFAKLEATVDETELWCLLMRELVAIGNDATPQVCMALDETNSSAALRRLAFALRAIGDARAAPALIRAIERTLLPSSSDYGLIVADGDLTAFMQSHDLDGGGGGAHFGFGRPVREVFGALHKLTGQDFGDADLFTISLSEDVNRQVLQRRLYAQQARRWRAWWKDNWRAFTDDDAYRQVHLPDAKEATPLARKEFGRGARLVGEWQGAVLSPISEESPHAWHFYDLDTGFRPTLPASLPKEEDAPAAKQRVDWLEANGVDLMCVAVHAAEGTKTYALKGVGLEVREISLQDLRRLETLLTEGKLPEGRPVDGLLLHYDVETKTLIPDANAAFLFETREGNRGVIEVTDRVTRTADLTGRAGVPEAGIGFHLGVRFDLKAIVP